MAVLGYARVSTADQDLAAQFESLTAAGADRIFQEKISGARSDRPELAELLKAMQKGDTLLVTRLDRLARSTLDLLGILKRIGDLGATFKSLADTWADTSTPHGRLMLTVLGGLAEFERELIKARTGEGRRRAQAAGIKFGRKYKLTQDQVATAQRRLQAGEPSRLIAREYRVSRWTIERLRVAA